MRIPIIRGVIDRRILANFRVDPDVLAKVLPAPFHPQLVGGYGIAGICLIRLKSIRPRMLPGWVGIQSENAAHRIAVEWDVDGQRQSGVYIPRRDTSSRLNTLAGGRLFPGVHHPARFVIDENDPHYRVEIRSRDKSSQLLVEGERTTQLPPDSIFSSVAEVSEFFENGAFGYSPAATKGKYDGLELRSFNWQVEPLAVSRIESSFFNDRELFPPDSVTFDNALLMRDIDHEWHARESVCCEGVA